MSGKDLDFREEFIARRVGKVAIKGPSDFDLSLKFPVATTVDAMGSDYLQTCRQPGTTRSGQRECSGVSLKTLHNKLKE